MSDVYILTDASDEELGNDIVQKMNVCKYCSKDDLSEEEDLHYSDEYKDSANEATEETSDNDSEERDSIVSQPLQKEI